MTPNNQFAFFVLLCTTKEILISHRRPPPESLGPERKSQYHHRKTSLVVIDDEEQKINSPAFWFKQIRVSFACNQIFWKLFRNKDRTRPWTVMEWMVEGIMEIPFIQLSISYWDHWNVQSFCAVIFRPNPSGGVCGSTRPPATRQGRRLVSAGALQSTRIFISSSAMIESIFVPVLARHNEKVCSPNTHSTEWNQISFEEKPIFLRLLLRSPDIVTWNISCLLNLDVKFIHRFDALWNLRISSPFIKFAIFWKLIFQWNEKKEEDGLWWDLPPSSFAGGTFCKKEVRQLLLEGDFHAAAESGATISLFVRCLMPNGHYKHEATLVFARCKRNPNVNEIRVTLGFGIERHRKQIKLSPRRLKTKRFSPFTTLLLKDIASKALPEFPLPFPSLTHFVSPPTQMFSLRTYGKTWIP